MKRCLRTQKSPGPGTRTCTKNVLNKQWSEGGGEDEGGRDGSTGMRIASDNTAGNNFVVDIYSYVGAFEIVLYPSYTNARKMRLQEEEKEGRRRLR